MKQTYRFRARALTQESSGFPLWQWVNVINSPTFATEDEAEDAAAAWLIEQSEGYSWEQVLQTRVVSGTWPLDSRSESSR